ncbi:hypothetical protein [Kitasatospora phosalacinea]|uniref:Uncharacterized protein n=1 Tax=Kitasatospora phosalacinea TaxID=2065 RepID=A0ABW6GIA9_9ACTN
MATTPPDPALWAGLDPELPVALLPVRLETRFGTRAGTGGDGGPVEVPVLRVRIYPDGISVAEPGRGLWPAEAAAGAAFWQEQRAAPPGEEAGAAAHRRAAAWEVLVRQVGQARAVHVARATEAGDAVADRPPGPATARLLPDGWVLVGERGGSTVLTHWVSRPGGDLRIGPDRDRPAFDPQRAHLFAPDDPVRWLVDFGAALAVGMAAEVDLDPETATYGLDRLFVLGARPGEAAADLAGLLADHGARDGFALLAPGTPTNNLTDRPAGPGAAADADPYAGYRLVTGAAPPAAAPDGEVPVLHGGAPDGPLLAAALGLPPGEFAAVPGADGREQALARSAALALFPVTFGEVIGTLAEPWDDRTAAPDPAVQPFAREHVASFVRARGPLPAVRVGRQPYGVLPVLPAAGWVRLPEEPPLSEGLHRLLGDLRRLFVRAARGVPRLAGAERPAEELARVLGRGPVPHPGGYALRDTAGPVAGDAGNRELLERQLREQLDGLLTGKVAASPAFTGALGVVGVRHLLARTLGDLATGTRFERLVLRGTRPVTAAVARTDPHRAGWETPAGYLRRLTGPRHRLGLLEADGTPPTDLLYVLVEHALQLAGELDVLSLGRMLAPAAVRTAVAVPPELAESALTVTRPRVELFTRPAEDLLEDRQLQLPGQARGLALTEIVTDRGLLQSVLDGIGADVPLVPVNAFAGTRQAVADLAAADLTDAQYARLTGEALACAATRLDAWFTSLAAQRLARLRDRRPTGLQVGAWGVLVDVRPRSAPGDPAAAPAGWRAHVTAGGGEAPDPRRPADPVGYVHAPSLQQAVTAGMLRAGELAHRGDGSTVASLDLTSRRVRLARELLAGTANGQPLGALLGYRLERGLHDAGLHTLVQELRERYPQRRTTGAPGEPLPPGEDAVVPAEVVDGLDVWTARDTLATTVPGTADPRFRPVLAELDTAVEAVADLLVAEGLHRIATGRPEAAGAAFAALAEGGHPPETTVAAEPRSGVTLTHRLLLTLDGRTGTAGWDRTAPRALLAPRAELWAEQVLGPATAQQVRTPDGATTTLDALGLCALDLLAEARPSPGGPRPLDARCTADEQLLELASAAAELLATARPATSADLTAPDDAAPANGDPTAVSATPTAPAPPARADLTPLATAVRERLDETDAAIAAITAAAAAAAEGDRLPRTLLAPLARLGLPGAVGPGPDLPRPEALAAAAAALALRRDVHRLLALPADAAAAARNAALAALRSAPTGLDTLTRIVRRIGGDPVVPTVPATGTAAPEPVPGVPAAEVERWLARLGRVRPAPARLDDLALFREAAGQPAEPLTPCHLPPTPGLAWLGGPLDPDPDTGNPLRAWKRPRAEALPGRPDRNHTHLLLVGPAPGTDPHALVLDETTEVLPAPTVTTGLAVHYDAPGARPPQTVLLAVPADPGAPWSWTALHAAAREATDLALLRGVDLDDLAPTGLDEYLPLTYVRDDGRATALSALTAAPWPRFSIAAWRALAATL